MSSQLSRKDFEAAIDYIQGAVPGYTQGRGTLLAHFDAQHAEREEMKIAFSIAEQRAADVEAQLEGVEEWNHGLEANIHVLNESYKNLCVEQLASQERVARVAEALALFWEVCEEDLHAINKRAETIVRQALTPDAKEA